MGGRTDGLAHAASSKHAQKKCPVINHSSTTGLFPGKGKEKAKISLSQCHSCEEGRSQWKQTEGHGALARWVPKEKEGSAEGRNPLKRETLWLPFWLP